LCLRLEIIDAVELVTAPHMISMKSTNSLQLDFTMYPLLYRE